MIMPGSASGHPEYIESNGTYTSTSEDENTGMKGNRSMGAVARIRRGNQSEATAHGSVVGGDAILTEG
jgi:hypothetical protein